MAPRIRAGSGSPVTITLASGQACAAFSGVSARRSRCGPGPPQSRRRARFVSLPKGVMGVVGLVDRPVVALQQAQQVRVDPGIVIDQQQMAELKVSPLSNLADVQDIMEDYRKVLKNTVTIGKGARHHSYTVKLGILLARRVVQPPRPRCIRAAARTIQGARLIPAGPLIRAVHRTREGRPTRAARAGAGHHADSGPRQATKKPGRCPAAAEFPRQTEAHGREDDRAGDGRQPHPGLQAQRQDEIFKGRRGDQDPEIQRGRPDFGGRDGGAGRVPDGRQRLLGKGRLQPKRRRTRRTRKTAWSIPGRIAPGSEAKTEGSKADSKETSAEKAPPAARPDPDDPVLLS